MNYKRYLNLPDLLAKKSILLLGPRQTGKSTLIRSLISKETFFVDLTQADTLREYTANPERLRQQLPVSTPLLIIDEAQKIPELFDEVQGLLDRNKDLRVVLSGSSALRLKRQGINLLPGRIWRRELHPLVFPELKHSRIEDRARRGSLPGIIDSPDFREELKNYAGLYLEEEVRAEGLTRNVGAFGRFLPIAALSNTEQINYTNIANDTGIKLNTVRAYFEILKDTLIAHELPVFQKTSIRKAVATPKFFLFDQGIVNALLNRFEVTAQSELFGKAMEQIIFEELRAYITYLNRDLPLAYWRTHSKFEVDFVLGDSVAIEVKAKKIVTPKDERGLVALNEEVPLKRKIIVSLETKKRQSPLGNQIYPLDDFLSELWSGDIVDH